jgi:hypothetical protein
MNHIKYARNKISRKLFYVKEREEGITKMEKERGQYKEEMGVFRMHYYLAVLPCLPIQHVILCYTSTRMN